MLTITWTNPPPIPQATPRPITRELDQAADALLNNPGNWALLWTGIKPTTAKTRTTALRHRDPRIRCCIVTHRDTDTADLYARLPHPAAATLQVAS